MEIAIKRTICVRSRKDSDIFIIPVIGIINERNYYGYPVFSVAFAWLKWRSKIQFGAKKFVYKADGSE